MITSVNCEEKVNASLRLILQQSKKSKSFFLLCLLKCNYLMDNPDCESKKGFGGSAIYLLCFKNRKVTDKVQKEIWNYRQNK
jgi:hypothetical protein